MKQPKVVTTHFVPAKKRKNEWTPKEDKSLQEMYEKYKKNVKLKHGKIKTIARKLGRGHYAVKARLHQLRNQKQIKHWTPEDDEKLLNAKGMKQYAEVARELGRSTHAVVCRINILRKKGKLSGQSRSWSDADVQKLKELYPMHTTTELSKVLGRSAGAIGVKCHTLGLKKERASGTFIRKRPLKFKSYDQKCMEMAEKKMKTLPELTTIPSNMINVFIDMLRNAAVPGKGVDMIDAQVLNIDNYNDFIYEVWEKSSELCAYIGVENKFKIYKEGRRTWLKYG
jgi:hypothetical protein